jgi:HTH-type transcriptional regulator, sugar sensing transcriptional regulator
MNLELMLRTLVLVGFFQIDAEIYLHLTIEGPERAKAVAEAVKMPRSKVYRSLTRLREKRIVNATSQRPAEFSAAPFEEVLELFKKASLSDAEHMEQNRKRLLSVWQKMIADISGK